MCHAGTSSDQQIVIQSEVNFPKTTISLMLWVSWGRGVSMQIHRQRPSTVITASRPRCPNVEVAILTGRAFRRRDHSGWPSERISLVSRSQWAKWVLLVFAITHLCGGLTALEWAAEPVPHKETQWFEGRRTGCEPRSWFDSAHEWKRAVEWRLSTQTDKSLKELTSPVTSATEKLR